MKVVQINSVYGNGSTGVIVKEIQSLCLDKKIECHIAYSSSACIVPFGYKIGNLVSNKLHALCYRIGGNMGSFSILPTIKFLHYLDRIKPDVIHLHNLHSNYINLYILLHYIAKKDIRTIVTLHDCWYYTGGCYHYTLVNCNHWKTTCGNCPKRFSDTKGYVLDLSSSVLKKKSKYFNKVPRLSVTGVSNWVLSESLTNVFKGRPAYVIHNGVDTTIFRPYQSDLKTRLGLEDRFIIMGPSKKWLSSVNQEVLKYFITNMRPDEVLFLMGCENIDPSLPSNVFQYGYVKDRKSLAELYSIADVFANCTREESLSLVNVECQACGTPVVTFDGTGVQETVDGNCGFKIASGDYAAMLYQIRCIKQQGKGYYSASCRKWVSDHFSTERNYQQYINLYLDDAN